MTHMMTPASCAANARPLPARPARVDVSAVPVGVGLLLTLALALSSVGCAPKPKPSARQLGPYQNLGPKKVPAYLKGSVYEAVELANQEPLNISAFGLVGLAPPWRKTTSSGPTAGM